MNISRIPFAVTGMACYLPGADNLEKYWKLLRQGQSAIVRVPDERLHYDLYFDPQKGKKGKTYMDQAGLVDYPAFNSCRCPFPIDVAGHLESGHLLMCETAAAACRQANMDPFNLSCRRTGVYVGNNQSGDLASELAYSVLAGEAGRYLLDMPEFQDLTGERGRRLVEETVRDVRRSLPRYADGGLPSVAYHLTAAAVSRSLGLDGPAMVFDAACSSSLQALAVASRDLALGNTEMAIVGGASFFRVDSLMIFSAARSGSAKGSCPFCDSADGLIPAEGYVALTLKTLERALADGDPIQAVIHGIGVSSDGKGKSLWAPSSDGQYEAIVRSYESPERMGRLAYLEAHATSTAVGDLTELNALTAAFDGKFADGRKRPIGGVKANIGHALEAAGLAGLIKAVMVLQHDEVPPQINCEPFNTKVNWEKLPFYVPRKAEPLPPSVDGSPRMAGVNSFGIGGLNVHVALEEAPKRSTAVSVSMTGARSDAETARPAKALTDAAREPIAVIGFGAVLPGVRTLQDFGEVVFSGKNVFSDVTDDRWNASAEINPDAPDSFHALSGRGGFITDFVYDWRRHKIPPKQIACADPLQFMMLDAADAALSDAGYDRRPLDRMRTGVLVGSSFDTDFSLALSMGFRHSHFQHALKETLHRHGFCDEAKNDAVCDAYFKTLCERMTAIMDETGSFTPSSLSSRITKTYNLVGGAVTAEAGDVGALAVLSEAMNILRLRENDMMIVAAGSRMMGLPTFIRMGLAGRLSPDGAVPSVLDENSGKTVPGEGAGVFILKRLSDALADGDPIRCVLHGIGAAGVAPSAEVGQKTEAFRNAVGRAWRQTNALREAVRLVELSGASGAVVEAELSALAAEYPSDGPMALGEAQTQFGDLFAASGALSLLKARLELAENRLPKLLGFRRPNQQLKTTLEAFHLPTAAESLNAEEKPAASSFASSSFAAVSSWDPCGFFYHAVLEYRPDGQYRLPEKSAAAAASEECRTFPYRLVRFGAGDRESLIQAIRSNGALNRPFEGADAERLVALTPSDGSESAEAFGKRLAFAAEKLASMGPELSDPPLEIRALLERKNLFYGRRRKNPGKIAFLFSGQGSQYPKMLVGLLERFEPARREADAMNRTLRRLGLPDYDELTVTGAERLGKDVLWTQLSLFCADWLVFRSLDALGIRPDMTAGHSFGEFPALSAAGAWNFERGAEATRIRCAAIDECQDALGGMLSTTADAAAAEKFCAAFPGQMFPANLNAPDQTVIGGRTDLLPRLEKRLKEAGFSAKIIPVPRPFHTPLMASVQPILAERFRAVPPETPSIRFISSVTNRPTSDPEEILRNLAEQMTGPIDYVGLVRRLIDEGATLLVESGPKRVLTGLHDRILAEQDAQGVKILRFAPDAPGRDGGLGLFQLRALCEVFGYLDASAPSSKSSSAQAGKGELSRHRDRIRQLLNEWTVQRPVEGKGWKKANFSVETERQLTWSAAELGVLPETLGAWLSDVYGEQGIGREIVPAILEASDGWENPFDRMISRMEAENRIRRTITDERNRTLGTESETPSASGESVLESGPTDSVLITPMEFYRVVSRKDAPPARFPDQKYRRFRLALLRRESPEAGRDKLNVSGRILIYGDNALAQELAGRLAGPGREPVLLPVTGDPERDAAAAERLCEEKPTLHLFLTASFDASLLNPDSDRWAERRAAALGSYAVTQRWYAPILRAKKLASASLVAATASGGGFGIDRPSEGVEAGALAGLIKSLDLEAGFATNFAFRSKTIDFAPVDSPEFCAERILEVLAANVPYEAEIGFLDQQRVLPRLIPVDAEPAEDGNPAVLPEGRWIVTGGGRGITAFLARGIAKKYRLELILIGSSPKPEIPDEWIHLDDAGMKNLRDRITREAEAANENPQTRWNRTERALLLAQSLDKFRAEGVKATYRACDVSDRAALAALLDEIRRDGPITGVLHGAGMEVSCSFEKKEFATVAKTFAIKAQGAKNLIELTRKDPLRHFLGLGSIAGRLGSLGQSDYSMANDALAKLLDRLAAERPEVRVSLFHWGPWNEIGMAVRPEMKSNPILQQMTFLPPAEGLHYVLSELEAGREPVEKVFMAWDYFKLFYPVENNTPTEAERLAEERLAEERPAQGARAERKSGGPASASVSAPSLGRNLRLRTGWNAGRGKWFAPMHLPTCRLLLRATRFFTERIKMRRICAPRSNAGGVRFSCLPRGPILPRFWRRWRSFGKRGPRRICLLWRGGRISASR